MRLRVLAVGARQPRWVDEGFDEYARRLPGLELVALAPGRRTRGGDPRRARDDEARRLLARIPDPHHVVALDERGRGWDTAQLAARLERWLEHPAPTDLLIGGPDGLAPAVLDRATERWSLSPLTLPHGMVRVLVAEAVYRAWSLLQGHPYHRDGAPAR